MKRSLRSESVMGLVVLGATVGRGTRPGTSWRVAGVHGADINAASVLSAEDEPRHSNDPCRVLRRRAR